MSTMLLIRPGERVMTNTRSDRNTASSTLWVTNITVLRSRSQISKSSFCNLLADRFAAHGKTVEYFYLDAGRIVETATVHDLFGVERPIKKRARRCERIVAARADSHDAIFRLQNVTGAGEN